MLLTAIDSASACCRLSVFICSRLEPESAMTTTLFLIVLVSTFVAALILAEALSRRGRDDDGRR